MRLSKVAAAVVSAGALFGFVHQAHANAFATEASAQVSGLTFRLIDLTPDDGVSPWLQFSSSSQVGLIFNSSNGTESLTITPLPGGILSAPAGSIDTGDGFFSANYTPLAQDATARLGMAEIANMAPSVDSQFGRTGGVEYFYGTGIDEAGFPFPLEGDYALTLSPNTALVIESNVSLFARATSGDLFSSPFAQGLGEQGYTAEVNASAFFGMVLDSDEWTDAPEDFTEQYGRWFDQTVSARFFLGATGGDVLDEDSWAGTVAVGHYNGSDSAKNLYLNFLLGGSTQVYSFQGSDWPPIDPPVDPGFPPVTPAIPEPSTYALMLLGLGGVAVAARQRRRQMAG